MIRHEPDRTPRSWQQLVAAYADGELHPAEQERVRIWLDANPDTYSRLEEQRSLSPQNAPFWESVGAPAPEAVAWARVWNRIEAGLERPSPAARSQPRSRGPWWRRGLIAVITALPCSAAAAAIVAVCLPDRPLPEIVGPVDEAPTEEVYQVAAANDVEILSIRDVDVSLLVVGEPPFNQSMLVVAAGDVRLEDLQPADDGMMPEARMGNDAPLIYSPVPRAP